MVLCLPGLICLVQRKENWELSAVICRVPIFTMTLIALVIVGAWRYRLIVFPGIFLLAGYGIIQMMSWYSSLRHHLLGLGDASGS